MPVIPSLQRQKQEDLSKSEASLVYISSSYPGLHTKICLNNNNNNFKKKNDIVPLLPFNGLRVMYLQFQISDTNILGGYHCLLGMWVGTLTRYRTHSHGEDDHFNVTIISVSLKIQSYLSCIL